MAGSAADEIERLRAANEEYCRELARCVVIESRLKAEIERLRAEVTEWHECALYDPLMDGPRFKRWNRSALDRCRVKFIEAALNETENAE